MVESVIVSTPTRQTPAPPIGIVASIASGFEAVNARLELILLPLALDLLLWLGPHLSVKPVMDQMLALMQTAQTPAGVDAPTAQNFESMRQSLMLALTAYGDRFNLFSVLSTAPLGLPSLLASRAPIVVPGGLPRTWYVDSSLEYLLLFSAFLLLGLFLGALYFGAIAQQARDARVNWLQLSKQIWGDWARLTAFSVVAVVVLAVIGLPAALVSSLVALLSPEIARFILITLVLWFVVYFGFTLHGVVLQRRGLLGALWDSVRLAHASLPQTISLYAAIVLINLGLGYVWTLPADDSWLLFIGLAGHALIATALVAATFAFYKDRYRWWQETRAAAVKARTEAKKDEANRRTKA